MDLPKFDLRQELYGTAYESILFFGILIVFTGTFIVYLLYQSLVGTSRFLERLFLFVLVPLVATMHVRTALRTAPRESDHWLPPASYSLAIVAHVEYGVVWPVPFLREMLPKVFVLLGLVTTLGLIASCDTETTA
ncbi:hypothetical protein [Haloarchaeobius iranensis]|uniref:Uncharacterized protein n=1 Tax=Haloarchaeobius iranensis TaxID=996166 RepID=A0A1G9T840_9EURY|nr:hypothetical protein [Haloarchaeobius iranensis]SDM43816.1 hypothetical protein SAMN05192554_102191 [Haloarchaeobius iranensis]